MSRWPVRELAGQKFNMLTVLRRIDGGHWLCRCDCGTEKNLRTHALTSGIQKSCGCWNRKLCTDLGKSRIRHGHNKTNSSKSKTYAAWANMIQRCTNKKRLEYKNYGGRGIRVCERWQEFENFLTDMGESPDGLSLDRIDNNGNYEPSNCRWATLATQIRNRRRTRIIEGLGLSLTLREWSKRLNISNATLLQRLERWPLERALSQGKMR